MPKTKTTETKPFSLRLTLEERARLERQAAGLSLGAYIRERLLGSGETSRRTRGKFPVRDHAALAQVLALLGRSELAASLATLARAASTGSLPVPPETEATLQKACQDVAAVKSMLMKALGIAER